MQLIQSHRAMASIGAQCCLECTEAIRLFPTHTMLSPVNCIQNELLSVKQGILVMAWAIITGKDETTSES